MTTDSTRSEASGAFEDRLLASLTEIDGRRAGASGSLSGSAVSNPGSSGSARLFGRLMRPLVFSVAATLVVAGAVVAAGVVAPRLFEPAGVPQVAGDQLAAKGSGCAPGANVTIALDGAVIGTVTAYEAGDFSASVAIPGGTEAGSHETTASCAGPDGTQIVQTATIQIVTERPPLGPVTNANLIEAVAGGSVTLDVGPVKADTDVAVSLDGRPFTTLHATADGWIVAPVTVPADAAPGEHAFRATGVVPDGRAFDQTTEVSVTAP